MQPKPGLGNVNPRLYELAQKNPSVFHDIASGDTIIPCTAGSPDCTTGSYGFKAGPGYDRATGLGSLDVYQFVTNWASSAASTPSVVSTTTSATATPPTIPANGATVVKATVKAAS